MNAFISCVVRDLASDGIEIKEKMEFYEVKDTDKLF